jgi:hypothetical protein
LEGAIMNDFLMVYRRGNTESITQVSMVYYYKNHPKNIPILDVKYDGTDILKIYEDCNVVVESNKYTQIVNDDINKSDGLINYLQYLNNDITAPANIFGYEFSLYVIFIHCKKLLEAIEKEFGTKTAKSKKSKLS